MRHPPQYLVMAWLAVTSSIAASEPFLGNYYTEDRTLSSPIADPTGTSLFASAVAIGDGFALVGASRESQSGNAHLYNSRSGALLQTLSPDSTSVRNFGRTVGLNGNYAIVGSDDATYVYDTRNYELLYTLPESNAIDTDDGRVLISSRLHSYVYDLPSGNLLATLGPGGNSVAISGKYAVISFALANDRGEAWVFDWESERLLYDLAPASLPSGAEFGRSVAADDDTVVVGVGNDPSYHVGSAYVFDLATGNLRHRLEGSLTDRLANFGCSVSVESGVAIVGAFRQSGYFSIGPNGQPMHDFHRGAAYAFSVQTGQEIGRFTTSGSKKGGWANYGFSVDYDGNQLIAGTLGFPKRAYITEFVIPEPSAVSLILTIAIYGSLLGPRRLSNRHDAASSPSRRSG